jgi:hypothetical protein
LNSQPLAAVCVFRNRTLTSKLTGAKEFDAWPFFMPSAPSRETQCNVDAARTHTQPMIPCGPVLEPIMTGEGGHRDYSASRWRARNAATFIRLPQIAMLHQRRRCDLVRS